MNNILFVCTGNIFRSRFAEEVFNHLCKINDVEHFQYWRYQRKIYWPAMNELERLKIIPLRSIEDSVHINDIDVSIYNQIICMDEEEHKPMVRSNELLSGFTFQYWNIVDMPKVPSDNKMLYKNRVSGQLK